MKLGNVLSIFDGMSCIQIALRRAGIAYDKCYAAEIDKYAIKATKNKFPNTIHLGDVTKVKASDLPKINLLCGGSPCQGFSFAGKGLNFEDPRSKLFFEFIRLLKEVRETNPDVLFLLENVRMKKEHENVISRLLGIQPININATLVSAQNRERLFWTNINMKQHGLFGDNYCDIPQPKDRGILLKDILEKNVADKYYISQTALNRMLRKVYSNPKVNPSKTGALNTKNNSGQLSVDSGTTLVTHLGHAGELLIYDTEKSPSLKVGGYDDINLVDPDRSKAPCLTVAGNGSGNHSDIDYLVFGVLNDNGELRETGDKSTCIDANYFKGVDSHAQRTMVKQTKCIQVLSLYDNNSDAGRVYSPEGKGRTLKGEAGGGGAKMGLVIVHNTAPRSGDPFKGGTGSLSRTDGKTYCLQTTTTNLIEFKDCVSIRGRYDENGEIIQQLEPNETSKTNSLTTVQKDNLVREVIQVNPNTESGGIQPYQQNRIYDSAGVSPALMAEMSCKTHAVLHGEKIRRLTPVECCRLQCVPDDFFKDESGGNVVSESQQYKMLGNGWNVDVICHILSFIAPKQQAPPVS